MGGGGGGLGMLESHNLGILSVSNIRIFPLTFILGRGARNIDLLGMLFLVLIGMLEVSVPHFLPLVFMFFGFNPRWVWLVILFSFRYPGPCFGSFPWLFSGGVSFSG